MLLSKKEIAEQLKNLGMSGSVDAGKLRQWVVENMHLISDDKSWEIEDQNFFDTDYTRIYVLRLVRKIETEILKPAWSFLWLKSKKTTLHKAVTKVVFLTIQLGTTSEDFFTSGFPPTVTSESGLSVS